MEKVACGAWLKSIARGRKIHWLLNPGNAGDSLIAAATELVFRKEGLNFLVVADPLKFDSSGKFVCYGGGGNLVCYYQQARRILQAHHDSAARLVILPHTIQAHEDLLATFSSRVSIICRDPISYAHCLAAAPKAEVLVADDLALSLRPESLLGRRIIPSALTELKTYALLRRAFLKFVNEAQGSVELAAWRGDRERHPLRRRLATNDISRLFSLDASNAERRSLGQLRISAHFLLRAVNQFSSVRTDRLHVAIAAALLEKDVELCENSYYKNQAVFEFSLSSFPNVRFARWT